jgi:uridylate kinase
VEPDPQPKYRRILLKLSGEMLAGSKSNGIDPDAVFSICNQIKEVKELGVEIALVLGGGNIFRGLHASKIGMNRADADYMGMLATLINGMALKDKFQNMGLDCRLMSAVTRDSFTEPYQIGKACEHLTRGRLIILAGGTGNPFFSTDTAAALRAAETGINIILKATKVDGVYSEDPEINPGADFYPRLSHMDVVKKGLQVMDLTSITLCRENKISIIVFDMKRPGNLRAVVMGDKVGTVIS